MHSFSALQVGFLKYLGEVATVLLDSVFVLFLHIIPDRPDDDDDEIRSLCGALAVVRLLMNVWKCKVIFPTDTLQQKIHITDLNPFLAGENTPVLIMMATTVYF